MTDFARGSLLSQNRVTNTETNGPLIIFQAGEVAVEVTLILVAFWNIDTSAVAMYHDDSGQSIFDQSTGVLFKTLDKTDTAEGAFSSDSIGSGIHVQPNGQIAIDLGVDANDATFSVYGVTQTLQEVR